MAAEEAEDSDMFTGHEKDRLRRLERWADWLEARWAIAQSRGRRLDLDEAELSALRWAVEQLRQWELVRPERPRYRESEAGR